MTAPLPGLLDGELPLRVIRASVVPGPLELRCRCGQSRESTADAALVRLAAHCLVCETGALVAVRDPGPLKGEQPVRLIRVHRRGAEDRVALACVCGAEAAGWRWGSHTESVRLKTHFKWPQVFADLSLDGLGQMLRHCGACPAAVAWMRARPSLPAELPKAVLW